MVKSGLNKKQTDLLSSFDKDKLLEIIYALVKNNEQACSVLVGGYLLESKDLLKLIEKGYKQRTKSNRFFDYYETDAFFAGLHDYLNSLLDKVIPVLPEESESLLSKMLQDFERLCENKDTSSGGWQDFYYYLIDCWIKALSLQKNQDSSVIANKIFNVFQSETFFSISSFDQYKAVLGLETFRHLRDMFYQHGESHEALEISYLIKDTHFFKTYLDERKEFEYPMSYLNYAQLLIEDVRADEAIIVLEDFINMDKRMMYSVKEQAEELLIKAYLEEGKKEQAKKLCIEAFKGYCDHKFYQLYVGIIEDSEKAGGLKLFLDIASQKQAYSYLTFLIAIEQFDIIDDYVLKIAKTDIKFIISMITASKIRSLSNSLNAHHFPRSATFLRRALVDNVLGEAKSRYYQYAVSDLKKSLEYGETLKDSDGVASSETYLAALYDKHKKKSAFWPQALEKINAISVGTNGIKYDR
ncbi:conserved hypothetical protein [Xenorhabdus innexi]|uniref:Uncharacterized protein n=2 Tax=Xenorhabdus innexi TaxID=290109 RepID=A0A1N6MT36_9GAMM|nr:DUF6880 family protein [Xenorhabdus innexi]PHM36686.1 hypothetical protein Xinn_01460 [Xenorhabdus innexi]SIP71992.1 conserved hypothetical protein [Xenorhabdus innexi]